MIGNTADVGDDELPSSVPALDFGVAALSLTAGGFHNCVRLADATTRCWGHNGFGQLGLGDTSSIGNDELGDSAPALDVGLDIAEIARCSSHTCARDDLGAVRCWGSGVSGQLGYGADADVGDDEPVSTVGHVDIGDTAASIALGEQHTVGVTTTGLRPHRSTRLRTPADRPLPPRQVPSPSP